MEEGLRECPDVIDRMGEGDVIEELAEAEAEAEGAVPLTASGSAIGCVDGWDVYRNRWSSGCEEARQTRWRWVSSVHLVEWRAQVLQSLGPWRVPESAWSRSVAGNFTGADQCDRDFQQVPGGGDPSK